MDLPPLQILVYPLSIPGKQKIPPAVTPTSLFSLFLKPKEVAAGKKKRTPGKKLQDPVNVDCNGFILADNFGCYKVILKTSPSGMNAKFLDKKSPSDIISSYIVLTPSLATDKGKVKGKKIQ